MSNLESSKVHLRIKVNSMEIEYEGNPEFIGDYVKEFVDQVLDTQTAHIALREETTQVPNDQVFPSANIQNIDLSTSSFAATLSVKSGPDLIIAAAAKLRFTDGKSTFNRKEIIEEMRNASGFFKQTYVNNLTKSLDRLLRLDRLRETSSNTYSLSSGEESQLKEILKKSREN